MSAALTIAVLQGGPAAEAEVSRSSAREVATALRHTGHTVQALELDTTLPATLSRHRPDVVFPALHGPIGEDGTVQGLLEILELPYVGSDVRGSALAMDKGIAKALYRLADLPVADEVLIEPDSDAEALLNTVVSRLGERVVVKPRCEGSALGVVRATTRAELAAGLDDAVRWPRGGIAEPYLAAKEVTVGVLDLHGEAARALPAIQIETAQGEWYDYRNRYAPGRSQHLLPAPQPPAVLDALAEIALTAHRVLGLRDLSRSDFLVGDDGAITLLETNTMPGMTPTSLYPDGAAALGFSFPELMEALVRSALRRAEAS